MKNNKINGATRPLFIILIVLIEGFVTVSLQILTIRQLIPFTGHSVGVTSIIIGVFLLTLAYGYQRGGHVNLDYWGKLTKNFAIACPLIGFGLAYPLLELYFIFSKQFLSANLYISLLIYLILITGPTVYLLGQTVPISMNIYRNENQYDSKVGMIGGKILHISTIGSFMGSVFTALILMNYFGVAATIIINVVLLLFLIIAIQFKTKANFSIIAIQFFLILIIYKLNIHYENIVFVKTNHHANYAIEETIINHVPGRLFKINNSFSSFLDKESNAFNYIELIKKILFKDLKLNDKEILIIGAGGFSLTAQGDFDNKVTYLDIDRKLPEIAIPQFTPKLNGQFVSNDARSFFINNKKKYDVIVSDVYTNMHEIPSHLVTKEYFLQIKSSLNSHGFALFNIIANPTLNSSYSKRIDNTLRSVFSNCMSIPYQYHNALTNIIYTCSLENENELSIYTDDKNIVALDLARHPLSE